MRNRLLAVALLALAVDGACAFDQVGGDIDGESQGAWAGGFEYRHGTCISTLGSRVAVGFMGGSGYRGFVRVYERDETNSAIEPVGWTKIGNDIMGESSGDEFGSYISCSDDLSRLAVAGPYNDEQFSNGGHVRVFELQSGEWVQLGGDIDGITDHGQLWVTISADGNCVAVRTWTNSNGLNKAGFVRVLRRDTSNTPLGWTQMGDTIYGDNDNDSFGFSVSLSGDCASLRMAIGSTGSDASGTDYTGLVRVFDFDEVNGWTRVGMDIWGDGPQDTSGHAVSISADGSRVAIGSPYNDDGGYNSGQVRIFARDTSVPAGWSQLGSAIVGESENDQFGYSLSLSAAGTRLAVGAPSHDGAAGVGTDVGHVRIFDYENGAWTQVGDEIEGEFGADPNDFDAQMGIDEGGDMSGTTVRISPDGTHVAITAALNDGPGSRSFGTMGGSHGHVRVFALGSPAGGVAVTCDASTAPANAKSGAEGLGDCSASLAAGASCTPVCQDGYTAVAAECSMTGDLTAAECAPPSAPPTADPANATQGEPRNETSPPSASPPPSALPPPFAPPSPPRVLVADEESSATRLAVRVAGVVVAAAAAVAL